MKLPSLTDAANYWDKAEHSFEKLIVKTMQQDINAAHNLYHQIVPRKEKISATVVFEVVDKKSGQPKKRQKPGRTSELRKKRNVIASPVHSKYALIKVVAASLKSNISLTMCTFKITYDGGEETHLLNLEEGVFIEDPKPMGEVEVSAFIIEIPVPERASTTQHLNIVWTGRN